MDAVDHLLPLRQPGRGHPHERHVIAALRKRRFGGAAGPGTAGQEQQENRVSMPEHQPSVNGSAHRNHSEKGAPAFSASAPSSEECQLSERLVLLLEILLVVSGFSQFPSVFEDLIENIVRVRSENANPWSADPKIAMRKFLGENRSYADYWQCFM